MYGRILLVFQTAFMMQFFFQSFFITSEKPKLGLAFTVLAGLTNIVLDFLLVGVLRGGIVGAASATVISQMVGGIGPMFYFFNRKNSSLLHFVRPKFSAKALGKACANGSSELMTNLSASLVSALYNLQLMKLIGRRRRGGLRRVDVRGLYLCSGVHRLCPGLMRPSSATIMVLKTTMN